MTLRGKSILSFAVIIFMSFIRVNFIALMPLVVAINVCMVDIKVAAYNILLLNIAPNIIVNM